MHYLICLLGEILHSHSWASLGCWNRRMAGRKEACRVRFVVAEQPFKWQPRELGNYAIIQIVPDSLLHELGTENAR